MHDAHAFLVALTVVLCTAGVTTVLFHRLRQPVVLGYILAGLIVSPSVPIPLLADRHIIETLSELGVILLMFSTARWVLQPGDVLALAGTGDAIAAAEAVLRGPVSDAE
jgi:predicted Kef-type K+ transport protein